MPVPERLDRYVETEKQRHFSRDFLVGWEDYETWKEATVGESAPASHTFTVKAEDVAAYNRACGETDPLYVDPYWLGAMILSVEVRDVDGALALLEKGMENNPSAWILPYLAGWEAEGADRPLQAAAYFERAAAIPDSPSYLRRMGAGMMVRAGRIDDALRDWEEVLHDPQSDEISRVIAARWLRILETRKTIQSLESTVQAFRDRFGRPPRRLDELAAAGLIASVPVDPDGAPYSYDPATGRVSSPAGRILGEE